MPDLGGPAWRRVRAKARRGASPSLSLHTLMSLDSSETVRYKRNHFSARLPKHFTYSLSHCWLTEMQPGLWRVGFTNFATRMLGEVVEFDFEVKAGDEVAVAQVVGWIEGFKAVSDIFCVAQGTFECINESAAENSELICSDPYGEGWLYQVSGKPDPQTADVDGYVEHLDRTIDKMLEKPWQSGEVGPP